MADDSGELPSGGTTGTTPAGPNSMADDDTPDPTPEAPGTSGRMVASRKSMPDLSGAAAESAAAPGDESAAAPTSLTGSAMKSELPKPTSLTGSATSSIPDIPPEASSAS